MNWESFIIMWILGSLILNHFVDMRFEDPNGWWPWLDRALTFLFFKILWPLGLILFVIKWYQGKATINR